MPNQNITWRCTWHSGIFQTKLMKPKQGWADAASKWFLWIILLNMKEQMYGFLAVAWTAAAPASSCKLKVAKTAISGDACFKSVSSTRVITNEFYKHRLCGFNDRSLSWDYPPEEFFLKILPVILWYILKCYGYSEEFQAIAHTQMDLCPGNDLPPTSPISNWRNAGRTQVGFCHGNNKLPNRSVEPWLTFKTVENHRKIPNSAGNHSSPFNYPTIRSMWWQVLSVSRFL